MELPKNVFIKHDIYCRPLWDNLYNDKKITFYFWFSESVSFFFFLMIKMLSFQLLFFSVNINMLLLLLFFESGCF